MNINTLPTAMQAYVCGKSRARAENYRNDQNAVVNAARDHAQHQREQRLEDTSRVDMQHAQVTDVSKSDAYAYLYTQGSPALLAMFSAGYFSEIRSKLVDVYA